VIWENYVHASRGFAVLYGFSIAYLVAPTTFSSANVVEVIAGLPEGVKYAGKAILAAPFAFHSFNGLRHLGWDMVKCTFFHALVPF
jgi:succinate dehydrogenase (ubiquinone) cytochrome b560 subunit